MKTLYLLRHAKSSHDIANLDDLLRPLNVRGYNDAKIVAAHLKTLKPIPDLIISSHAVRTYTTSIIFAEYLKIKSDKIKIENSLYFTGKNQIIKFIKALDDHYNNIMLVGHNPDFEKLVQYFTSNKTVLMPTTCLAVLNFDVKKWIDVKHSNCKLVTLILPTSINPLPGEIKNQKESSSQITN